MLHVIMYVYIHVSLEICALLTSAAAYACRLKATGCYAIAQGQMFAHWRCQLAQ